MVKFEYIKEKMDHINLLLTILSKYVIAVYSCSSPADICLIEANNGNTRTMIEICFKLTAMTSERCHCHRFDFWTYFTYFSDLSTVEP